MAEQAKRAKGVSPLAGKPAPKEMLIDVAKLERDYFERRPDVNDPNQLVSFGTSGHRGSPFQSTFTEAHILAITQAICEYRRGNKIDGPLYMGKDTHAISGPAQRTALEVLAANGVETKIQSNDGVTPTPVISHAILVYNRGRKDRFADGIVITPSHNPPRDGGFKYNPPNGGPADTDVTNGSRIAPTICCAAETRTSSAWRIPRHQGQHNASRGFRDAVRNDLRNVVDTDAIRAADLNLGVDPLGGAARPYWEPINEVYGLKITVVNPVLDPTFSFMTVDHDGEIRMDCSSPYAMARLVRLKDKYRLAFANDPDSDRHGIVTPVGWFDEPKSLSCRSDRLFADTPAEVVEGRYCWQDAGEQQPDRSSGEETGRRAFGSSRWIQMVCVWLIRWVILLRRGRKRGGELSPA